MKTILPIVCGIAVLAAAGPAQAKTYSGETKGGYAISFKASGSKVSKLVTTVPATCASTKNPLPRAGGELFEPPGAFGYGKTTKVSALQQPAMHYDEVTKNYHVTVNRKANGRVTGKLHVNWSHQTVGYGTYTGHYLETWICQGDDRFSLR